MNAFQLIPEASRSSDPFWVGWLSMSIAQNLSVIEKRPKDARADLRAALEAYLRSPLPTEKDKRTLREEMRR